MPTIQPIERKIDIYEVGFRDWRFCHQKHIATEIAVNTIEMLLASGINEIEIGASVNYEKFPFMNNSYEILVALRKRNAKGIFSIYASPFEKHYPKNKIEKLIREGKLNNKDRQFAVPDEISVSISASEERNNEIYHIPQDKIISGIKKIIDMAKKDNIKSRGYVSAAFGYKNKDDVVVQNVIGLCELLFDFGCYEVSLGDTRGNAEMSFFIKKWKELFPYIQMHRDNLSLHFHEHNYLDWQRDITQVLRDEIREFDTSIIDLPAPKKKIVDLSLVDDKIPPNASTLKMVEFISQMGKIPEEFDGRRFVTGIDYEKVLAAHNYIRNALQLGK